ncbi:MAG: PRC-barrel domain-containing protein [Xanthomonadaceae bacterium]|nr:PRC-barrel domain-containing protein [Xanthomonadaceae bacterium]
MNTLSSLKYSAVLLPVLALGMPIADAQTGNPGNQSAEQRTMASDKSKALSTTQRGYLDAMPARGFHSDNLVGKEVTNRRNNETVGEVSNLVLDEDGQVVAVILSIGGLLGMGERDVAIEWDQINRRIEGDEVKLSVDLTEESLDDAPKYKSERSTRSTAMIGSERDDTRSDKSADQRTNKPDTQFATQTATQTPTKATNQTATHAAAKPSNRTAAQPAAKSSNQTANTGEAAGGKSEYVKTLPTQGFHSDSMVGKEVKSRQSDESIGEISNLVLDNNGQVVAAIISVGGRMGIGEHDVAIAFDQIERRVEGEETTLWVNLTEQSLQDAPQYSSDPKTAVRNR